MKAEIPKPIVYVILTVVVGGLVFAGAGMFRGEDGSKVREDDYKMEPRDFWKGKIEEQGKVPE